MSREDESELKELWASGEVRSPQRNPDPRCRKCGFTMCELMDDKKVSSILTLATPTGNFHCFKCDGIGSAAVYTTNQMVEVLTALWDMQTSPDCWCDAGDGAPMHSPACAYARDVSRKYKSLAST